MPQDIRQMMHETIVNLMDESTVLDDRVKLSSATRARLTAKGLQFPVPSNPLIVVMMDDIIHTIDFPICGDETCICNKLEYERSLTESKTSKPRRRRKTLVARTYEPSPRGALGPGNQGFRLMR